MRDFPGPAGGREVGPARFCGLDTLRAAAVLAVVLYHLTAFGELPSRLLPVAYFGWMGVDLFFVLSGFLIGQQILKPYTRGQRPSIAEFYRRRAYRILPSYIAVLALYLFVPSWREAPGMAPLWKFLTFTMNFGFHFDRRAFSHAWSLCVEEHFYLVLPVLVLLLMRRPSVRRAGAVLAAIVLGGIALRAWLLTRFPDEVWTQIYYPSYTRLDGLVTGVGLATMRSFRPSWWNAWMRRGHALLLCGVACVGVVLWMFRGHDLGSANGPAAWGIVCGFPLLATGLGLITASSVSYNSLLARVKIPGAETLATLAFPLYLTHKEVGHLMTTLFPLLTAAQGPSSWMLYAISTLSAAWILHLGVERPFLWLRDLGERRRSQTGLGPADPELQMRRDPAL